MDTCAQIEPTCDVTHVLTMTPVFTGQRTQRNHSSGKPEHPRSGGQEAGEVYSWALTKLGFGLQVKLSCCLKQSLIHT